MLSALDALTRPAYFDTYLGHLESDDILVELERSGKELNALIASMTEEQLDHRYAPGKWSIRQVVQHLVDTELIFNYRAIRIGREETSQNLEGFDENAYAAKADGSRLSGSDLMAFFHAVRTSTGLLYQTFSDTQLELVGIASGNRIQIKSLFYINAGHTLHHAAVIRERYLQK
ncbi:MAG: DinB family protein [Flavobacteriales bacterium]|nr:DinB family protein [Flavobacteriales bacterium]